MITPSFYFLVRRNPFEVLYKKDVLQICCKFTGEHLYRSVISIKLHTASCILVFDRYFCILELLQAILQDPHKRFSYRPTLPPLLFKATIFLKKNINFHLLSNAIRNASLRLLQELKSNFSLWRKSCWFLQEALTLTLTLTYIIF